MKAGRRFRSIQKKLTFSSAVVMCLMTLLIEFCVYTTVVQIQLRDTIRFNSELILTMGRGFDSSVESFKQQINYVTMDSTLQERLTQGPGEGSERLVYANALRTSLVSKTLATDQVEGIYLYDQQGELITFWQKKYDAGDPYTLFPDMGTRPFSESGTIGMAYCVGRMTYNRTIRSTRTLERLGYITFVYDMDALREVMNTITPSNQRFVAIFDENGDTVLHNYGSEETLQQIVEKVDLTKAQNNEFVTLPKLGESLVSRYDSALPGWSLVCVVEKNQLQRSSNLTQLVVMLFGVAGAAIGVFLSALNARRIVRPLKRIMHSVQKSQEGDYHCKATVSTADEIEILASAVNTMLDKIDTLINKGLKSELAYKEMQLTALQSQINPHFLYNTLECINSLAQLGRRDEVRQVTVAFSNIMKSLAKGPRVVSVRDEIAYTRDFLMIYKILLEERLEYHIDMSEDCAELQIPRLVIQPLVENAVLHGVKSRPEGGYVSVTVFRTTGELLLSVSDDGVGFPEQSLAAMKAYIAGDTAVSGIGVGVKNVVDRLRLIYGSRCRISVQSSAEWGTIIEIVLPIWEEEE